MLAILLSSFDAQKGGAKNALRNRGKSSGGGGGSRVGGGNRGVEVTEGGRYTGPGADSRKPTCFLRYRICKPLMSIAFVQGLKSR